MGDGAERHKQLTPLIGEIRTAVRDLLDITKKSPAKRLREMGLIELVAIGREVRKIQIRADRMAALVRDAKKAKDAELKRLHNQRHFEEEV